METVPFSALHEGYIIGESALLAGHILAQIIILIYHRANNAGVTDRIMEKFNGFCFYVLDIKLDLKVEYTRAREI